MTPVIEFRDVTKTYRGKGSAVTAVDGVSLSIERGEIFAVIGYSGAGKSTLARLVNVLERPTSGEVVIDGRAVSALSEREVRPVRATIGTVFQQFNLFRSRTVYGNVAYPLKVAGWSKEAVEARVTELLHFVGITDKAWEYTDQLSGGQKQRVGIARALANQPTILLADEATSALDPETTHDVLRLLKRVNAELGVTIVVITHEMDVVRTIADRVAVLERGRVIEIGSTFDVFASPRTPTARTFVGTVLRDRPDAAEVARLEAAHQGRLVSVGVTDGNGIGAVLGAAAREGDVGFEIVHGGIGALDGRSFGTLTLALTGSDPAVAAVVDRLRDVTTVTELAA
ncbi:methionine ABC transporter ATP-binding protein [Nakamurella deserti]|uniref:methionine ABC transporter ATP-binding protein n=1 Tax=Nakamurella deserti TaxID=2164074 RepID=UPI000DBEA1CD|nr:methionine ABC transporter ATP-binding protein [Nakamurella deserti]